LAQKSVGKKRAKKKYTRIGASNYTAFEHVYISHTQSC
jgi:hypothetical protein